MSRTAIAKRFLQYYFKATNRYKVHSPFVYQFVEEVLEDKRFFYAFEEIEDLRAILKRNKTTINITDYGAGSTVMPSKTRSIAAIAKHGITPPHLCRLLFRIVQFCKPKTILEMGTSLGISTLYMSAAALNSKVVTLEGCPNIAAVAKQNFELMKSKNINLIEGPFEKKLSTVLKDLPQLDFTFIDGNHQEAPTLLYFEQCLSKVHDNSVLVFDDIHWSEGMERAWQQIKQHPNVTLSIDLFFFGLVFFRKEQQDKAHHILIPSQWRWV